MKKRAKAIRLMTDYNNQTLAVGDKARTVSYMADSVTKADIGKEGVITYIARTRVSLVIGSGDTKKTLIVVPDNLLKLN